MPATITAPQKKALKVGKSAGNKVGRALARIDSAHFSMFGAPSEGVGQREMMDTAASRIDVSEKPNAAGIGSEREHLQTTIGTNAEDGAS